MGQFRSFRIAFFGFFLLSACTPAEIDAEQAKAKEVRLVSAKGKAKYHPVIPRPSPAKIRRAHCVR